ncbi:hypothetical protein AB0442_38750 [Kitasatospora sp. NPDC085895]|uniref:hypothetical protein n=1 Tax=Kitasatospora sp. NPDC085895 TaxID=3155057 RepID=UPI00344F533A
MGHSTDAARWRAALDQAMARIAGRFKQVEPPATARAFVLALPSGVERRSAPAKPSKALQQAGNAGEASAGA